MILLLHVIPKSRKNQLAGWMEGPGGTQAYKVKIAASPEDGKANDTLLKFLARQWKIPITDLKIISGQKARYKRLKINNKKVYRYGLEAILKP